LEKIHSATLTVLEKTGVKVESEEVRELLKSHGASIDGSVAKLPSSMVEKFISKINKSVTLASRDSEHDLILPAENTLNCTSGYAAYIYDIVTGEYRQSTLEDLIDFTVLADALDEVDLFWPIVMPTEFKSEEYQEVAALDIALRNTTKHVQCSLSTAKTAELQIELAAALLGGKDKLRDTPIFSVVASPFTPLEFKKGTAEGYLKMARAGVPVVPMNVPLAGTTAPATLAGSIVITNAEQLATLVILKCADEDAPMVYSSDTGTADMKTGDINYDSPDRPILCAAMAQVTRYYEIPSCVSHDSCEDKEYSTRQGFERNALRIAMNEMTHSDIAVWMGSRDDALSASMWDLLLDAEALHLANEYNRRFEVDDNTLAVEAIDDAGPSGNFISSKHTVKNFRKQICMYDYNKNFIFAGSNQSDPQNDLSDTEFVRRAKFRVREILKSHKPERIPEDKIAAMDEVMEKVRRELNG